MLDEAILVSRLLAKHLDVVRPVIMIAEHQQRLQRETLKSSLERFVGGDLTAFGQVAADGAEGRVAVMCSDVGKAGVQSRKRIESPQLFSGRNQMKVAKMDKLHGLNVASPRNRDSRSNPASSMMG